MTKLFRSHGELPLTAGGRKRFSRNRQDLRGAADMKSAALGGSSREDRRLFGHEPVITDDLAQLFERDAIARLEIEYGQAVVEAYLNLLDARHFPHRHAHGVGAGLSIHAECLHLDVAQLGLRG